MSYAQTHTQIETFTRIEPRYKCADISKEQKIAGRERLADNTIADELFYSKPLYLFDGQRYSLRGES